MYSRCTLYNLSFSLLLRYYRRVRLIVDHFWCRPRSMPSVNATQVGKMSPPRMYGKPRQADVAKWQGLGQRVYFTAKIPRRPKPQPTSTAAAAPNAASMRRPAHSTNCRLHRTTVEKLQWLSGVAPGSWKSAVGLPQYLRPPRQTRP